MSLFDRLYQIFLSENAKKRFEKIILYFELFGFLIHLILIYLSKLGVIKFSSESELFNNPISAIYTPFSFILIYEVYLLIYYLPKSFTTYITKQYEIITLIVIRKLFKDLSNLELASNWFEIKKDLQFTYDMMALIILFYLIYQFQKQGMIKSVPRIGNLPKLKRFIRRKKIIAIILVPLFFIIAILTLFDWVSVVFTNSFKAPIFKAVNNLFFDEFFTVLILVDVVLLLISFFYTDKFHKIIRNTGFIISTILIRISFGVTGLINTALILSAVLFGLIILIIQNKYEINLKNNN